MQKSVRIFLLVVGLVLLGISLAALVYALAPVSILREATPIAPTLFLPPAGAVP